jgi:gliding motility-associated-like protein
MYYYCYFTNACGTILDSVFVDVMQANVTAEMDTVICPGETANLSASGCITYTWYPVNGLNTSSGPVVYATPESSTVYHVIGVDANGCIDEDSVFVALFPEPNIEIIPGIVFADYGDMIQLTAISTTTGPYTWSPPDFLSCTNCVTTIANPEENFTYSVSYIDENGCSATDVVNIYYNPILYVPNTFTPGGDEFNQMFLAIISEEDNVLEFHLEIYNRWGELIFESFDFNHGWDGKYGNHDCQDGTYVWKIRLREISNETTVHTGHINLLR